MEGIEGRQRLLRIFFPLLNMGLSRGNITGQWNQYKAVLRIFQNSSQEYRATLEKATLEIFSIY